MAFRTEKEALHSRYLLGDLSDQEKVSIEESYFADDDHFQELEIVEDELVDAYVRDELNGAERKQFEKLLQSSTRLAERVQFARILEKRVGSIKPAPVAAPVIAERPAVVSWWQKIFSAPQIGRGFAYAGSAVIALMGVALIFTWLQMRESSRQLERERAGLQQQRDALNAQTNDQTSKINQLAADLEKERNLRADDQKLIESLKNGSTIESNNFSCKRYCLAFAVTGINPRFISCDSNCDAATGTDTRSAFTVLPTNEPNDLGGTYLATIRNQDGNAILSGKGLRARQIRSGSQIAYQFSAADIDSGDYIVTVVPENSTSVDPIANYAFRLVHPR